MPLAAPLARRAALLGLALISLISAATARPAAAQAGERCFPETGYCISGPIRDYWERNGGLPVFGYPISEQRRETVELSWSGPVQWFERDRLEDHSNEGIGVLAGRLGAQSLEIQGRPWSRGSETPGRPTGPCRYFEPTGYSICNLSFRIYWEQNGGLERFGYPITPAIEETIEGRTYTVQYFERRRMELHPEHAGTEYEVLLGLLGRDSFAATGGGVPMPLAEGDLAPEIQQAPLDAAYAHMRGAFPGAKLAAGLADLIGDYALVVAQPYGYPKAFLHVMRQGERWVVVAVSGVHGSDRAARSGFPTALLNPSDRSTIVELQLAQLQDQRGDGLNAYITRPRLAGDYARFWVVPAMSENRDPASTFYRREGGQWRFLTAGTAFPEDSLQELGAPRELWPYGEIVAGPR